MRRYRTEIAATLALAGATVLILCGVCRNGFVNYDDTPYVTDNPQVKQGLTLAAIRWAFTTTACYNWHPLTWLSLQLDQELFGGAAWGYHLTNLLFHTASACLLFAILRFLTGAVWPSVFAAALFALHPLHVESVAWIAERKDVLSTFFWMLTILAYASYATRPSHTRLWVTVGVFAVGLMAKPMLVTLPFVLLLLDYWPLKRFGQEDAARRPGRVRWQALLPPRRLLWEKLPFFTLSAISCLITYSAQSTGGAVISLGRLGLSQRLAHALVVWVVYIYKAIWPHKLSVFYPYDANPYLYGQALLAGLLLIAITVFTVLQSDRRPYLAVGWLWYLGTLVPVIGLIQVGGQACADRYTYIPLIGLFVIFAWGLSECAGRRHGQAAVSILAAGVLVCCGVISWRQVQVWHDSASLWTHALAITDRNPVAHNNLGVHLAKTDPEAARAHYRQARHLNPNYADPCYNLAVLATKEGKTDEALNLYTELVRLKPRDPDAYTNLGVLLEGRGNLRAAIAQFLKALEIDPDCGFAHVSLGSAREKQGNVMEAAKHYRQALSLNSANAEARAGLGSVLMKQGDSAAARAQFAEALRLEPNAQAENKIGVALERAGHTNEAVSHYREALQLQPDFEVALYNLGTILGKAGKLDEAAGHLTRALQINPDYAQAHYSLGIVREEQGDIAGAVVHFGEACRLRPDADFYRTALEEARNKQKAVANSEGKR
jgi:tetratricopeptide (TPR) repeat protein